MRHYILLFFICYTVVLSAQSLRLSAFGSWVSIGDLDITGNQITLEAFIFIKGDLSRDTLDIVSKHTSPTDVNYLFRPSGIEFTTYKSGNSGATQFFSLKSNFTYTPNRWYHVAATYDGVMMRYYVNGCLVNEMNASGSLFQNNFIASIGFMSTTKIEQFYGNIDEVRLWNIARTEAQIKENMADLANPTTQTGLKLYYKFNNNCQNLQGNPAYNGQLKGAAGYETNEPNVKSPTLNNVVIEQPCGQKLGSIKINAPSDMLFSLNQNPFNANAQFLNLDTGRYIVRTKPDEWCFFREDTFRLVNFKLKEVIVKNALCGQANGEVTLKTTDDANAQFSSDSITYASNPIFKQLKANTLRFFVKHSGGCSLTTDVIVKDSITLSQNVDFKIKNERCAQANGAIIATATGKGVVEYSLDSLNFFVKNEFKNLKSGTYRVYVRNSDGCKTGASTTLKNEDSSYLKIDKVETLPATCGLQNGSITIKIIGNTEGVTYALNPTLFRSINFFNNLKPTDYQLFIKDSAGCLLKTKVIIEEKKSDTLQFSYKVTPSVCKGKTGTLMVENIKNGIPPYQFALNDTFNFKEINSFVGLGGDKYKVFVRDSSGCATAQKEVLIPRQNCEVYIPTIFSPNEDGVNDVFKIFAVEGLIKTIKSYQIFNRWGNLIYVSPEQNTEFSAFNAWWDGTFQGKSVNPDVYIYVIEVEYVDSLNKYQDRILKGDIMLSR